MDNGDSTRQTKEQEGGHICQCKGENACGNSSTCCKQEHTIFKVGDMIDWRNLRGSTEEERELMQLIVDNIAEGPFVVIGIEPSPHPDTHPQLITLTYGNKISGSWFKPVKPIQQGDTIRIRQCLLQGTIRHLRTIDVQPGEAFTVIHIKPTLQVTAPYKAPPTFELYVQNKDKKVTLMSPWCEKV